VYFVPAAGETIVQIRSRTNSTAITELDGTVRDDPAYAVPGGTRLHVAGIRWHHTIAQDTRAQVANQNGVSLAALEAANGWAPAPGDTALSPGTLVLIPAH
jgi:hypothetical protein